MRKKYDDKTIIQNILLKQCLGINDFDRAIEALRQGADINQIDKSGNNLLHNNLSNIEVVKFLVENGIDIGHINNSETALGKALTKAYNLDLEYNIEPAKLIEYRNIVRYLVESGARLINKEIEDDIVKYYYFEEIFQEYTIYNAYTLSDIAQSEDSYFNRMPPELIDIIGQIVESKANLFLKN